MIPKKFAPMLFGAILSGLMSLLVSGIATIRAAGRFASRSISIPCFCRFSSLL